MRIRQGKVESDFGACNVKFVDWNVTNIDRWEDSHGNVVESIQTRRIDYLIQLCLYVRMPGVNSAPWSVAEI